MVSSRRCGAGCSETPSSPNSTAPTTAGTACRPACWRRRCCSSPHDKVSDAEAKARADFDLRWKVALGIEVEDRPFAKSTLQVFRAQLILHDKVREVFEGSLRLARESGYLKRRGMKVGAGHDQHPGAWRGEGYIQSVGGRDRQTGASAGTVEGHQRRTMGEESGIPSIPGLQRQGRSGHRLVRPAGAGGAAGRDCC